MAVQNAFLIFLISFSVIMGWLMMRERAPSEVNDTKVNSPQKTISKAGNKSPNKSSDKVPEEDRLISKKLGKTVLPIVDLEATTLEESLEFIRMRSIELGSTEPGLSLDFIISPDANGDSIQLIEFYAEDITISEALDHICEQVMCRWLVKDGSVTIYPL